MRAGWAEQNKLRLLTQHRSDKTEDQPKNKKARYNVSGAVR